jgi:hypothetical protein
LSVYSEIPLKIKYESMNRNLIEHLVPAYLHNSHWFAKNCPFWLISDFSKKNSDNFLISKKKFRIFKFLIRKLWPWEMIKAGHINENRRTRKFPLPSYWITGNGFRCHYQSNGNFPLPVTWQRNGSVTVTSLPYSYLTTSHIKYIFSC